MFVIIVAVIIYLPTKKLKVTSFVYSFFNGIWKMVGAAIILVLAWTIGSIIENLETGAFLAMLVEGNLPLWLLPAAFFILACFIAFTTRASCGTFTIIVSFVVSIIL